MIFAWTFSGVFYYQHIALIIHYFFVIYALAYLCTVVGYVGFHANIVQFNIDRLVEALVDELSSIIYWHNINGQLYLLYLKLDGVLSTFFFYYPL